MFLRWWFAFVCAGWALSWPLTVLGGEPETADALFDRAAEHMEAKRYNQACPAFAESYRLDPQLGALFALAECEALRGNIATAVGRYQEYLTLYAKLPADRKGRQGDRERKARAQVKVLQGDVPQLVVVLPQGAAAETVVKVDGAQIEAGALGAGLPVDPGEHVIVTQAPGGAETKTWVTLAKGEKKPLVADVRPAPAPAPVAVVPVAPVVKAPVRSVGGGPGWRPYAIWGGLGLAVVGVGVGVGLSAALPRKNAEIVAEVDYLAYHTRTIEVICPGGDAAVRCAKLNGLLDARDAYKGVSIAGFVVGGVGAVGAVMGLLWKPSVRTPDPMRTSGVVVVPSLNGVMVMGNF